MKAIRNQQKYLIGFEIINGSVKKVFVPVPNEFSMWFKKNSKKTTNKI